MKYFTPELLEQFRSKDDKIAENASDGWEKAAHAYAEYLQSVKPQLPIQFRRLLDNYYLHDAKVVFAGSRDRDFLVTLRLDTPPQDMLFLTYHDLVADAVVIRHGTGVPNSVPVEWLYDEIEVRDQIRRMFFSQASFRHSILLSNAWELQIHFRNFTFSPVAPVRSSNQVLVSGTCAVSVA